MMDLKKFGIIVVISFLSFACATPDNNGFMSAEEAKKLSIDLQAMKVPPPPRDSSDIREILSEIRSKLPGETMKSDQIPPDAKEIDALYDFTFGDSGSIRRTCLKESVEARMVGQAIRGRAIAKRGYELLKDSSSSEPWHVCAIGAYTAKTFLETGGFSEAMYYLDDALKQNVEKTWQVLHYANLYSLKAIIFALLGDYENAKTAIENAEKNLVNSPNLVFQNMVFGTFEVAKAQLFFGEGKDGECLKDRKSVV